MQRDSRIARDDGLGYGLKGPSIMRQRANEAPNELKESDYKILVESVEDYAIFMLDPNGRILSWNQGARLIKGYSADEIIGEHFSKFYTAEDLGTGKPAYELEVAARAGRFEDEGWRLRKDGTPFWANVVITALHEPSGTLRGFAKVTRDLTERRKAEQLEVELARAQAERIAAQEAEVELRRSHAREMALLRRLEVILEGVRDGISVQDPLRQADLRQ